MRFCTRTEHFFLKLMHKKYDFEHFFKTCFQESKYPVNKRYFFAPFCFFFQQLEILHTAQILVAQFLKLYEKCHVLCPFWMWKIAFFMLQFKKHIIILMYKTCRFLFTFSSNLLLYFVNFLIPHSLEFHVLISEQYFILVTRPFLNISTNRCKFQLPSAYLSFDVSPTCTRFPIRSLSCNRSACCSWASTTKSSFCHRHSWTRLFFSPYL